MVAIWIYRKKIHTPSRPIKDPNKNNPNNKIKELQERCNKLERALDKSCGELSNMFNDIDDEKKSHGVLKNGKSGV